MKKENLIKFYQKYKLFIFPTVVALSSAILIIFIIYPQTVKIITEKDVAESLSQRGKFLEAKAQTLQSFEREDLSSKVTSVLSAYPQDRDFATIIGLLQGLATGSSFSMVSLTLGQSQAGPAESYLVRLEALGPKILLDDLLKSIESSLRIMKVQNIEVSSSIDIQMVSVSLGIEVFYKSIPPSLGDLDSPLPQLTQEDEELLVKLAASQLVSVPTIPTIIGPRGKADPFQ